MPDLKADIETILGQLGIQCSTGQVARLNDYINLLDKWNKAYNLTAIRNIHEMLDRHIADSLSIACLVNGQRFIDVGTGPGLPGIPLAILYPDRQFVLLDSNGKKTRFLQQVKIELHLDNIDVVNDRVEDYRPGPVFDGVLSRAFTTLDDMLEKCGHLCSADGHYYAMKGQYPEAELQVISKPYKVHDLHWADNASERHLVIISQTRG